MTEFKRPSLDDWALRAVDELKGRDVDGLVWSTPEGIDVKALYSAEDLEGLDAVEQLPGFPPFLRGPRATMYAGRPWTMTSVRRVFRPPRSQMPSIAPEFGGGAKAGLSVAFDLATHRGYDSDHPRVVGDVGKAGVAIDSVEDMKILFDENSAG